MKALNNLLFYGNLEKETYNSVRGRINEDNRKSITLFTLIGAVCFGIAAFFAIFSNNDVPVPLYFAGVGAFVLIFLINKLGRKKLPIKRFLFDLFGPRENKELEQTSPQTRINTEFFRHEHTGFKSARPLIRGCTLSIINIFSDKSVKYPLGTIH